jgi:hypothetical protein
MECVFWINDAKLLGVTNWKKIDYVVLSLWTVD